MDGMAPRRTSGASGSPHRFARDNELELVKMQKNGQTLLAHSLGSCFVCDRRRSRDVCQKLGLLNISLGVEMRSLV